MANGDPVAFWQSRYLRGDKLAPVSLDVLLNRGPRGWIANIRLRLFDPLGRVNRHQLSVDLMSKHAIAIQGDTAGIPGQLSALESTKIHHEVFRKAGLPSITFGGTPFTGSTMDLLITTPFWCSGCDPVSGQ